MKRSVYIAVIYPNKIDFADKANSSKPNHIYNKCYKYALNFVCMYLLTLWYERKQTYWRRKLMMQKLVHTTKLNFGLERTEAICPAVYIGGTLIVVVRKADSILAVYNFFINHRL